VTQPALGASVTNVFSESAPSMNTVTTRATTSVNSYPKNSAWNSDESMLATWDWDVYDGTTYALLGHVHGTVSPNEGRNWANSDPRYIYGAHAQNKQWIRVDATNSANNVVLHTYTAAELGVASLGAISYGLYEGNIDDNDQYAVLIACTGAGYCNTPHVPFLINAKTGTFLRLLSGGPAYTNVYDTTISHDGTYALVTRPAAIGPVVDVYLTSTGAFQRTLNTTNEMPHWDPCVDSSGNQVAVELRRMYRMSDGTETVIFPYWLHHHVSCRNNKRPGYAYYAISNIECGTGVSDPSATTSYHKIFALKLDGSQRIENFAWDHQGCPQGTNADSNYARFPAAVPSRWGDRVYFRSTWDVTDGTVNGYVAHVPTTTAAGPLISYAGATTHVTWDGSALADSGSTTWTMTGTVPMVAAASPFPAGAGPFSAANYYHSPSAVGSTDYAGDFSVCVVMSDWTSGVQIVGDYESGATGAGWVLRSGAANSVMLRTYGSGSVDTSVPASGEALASAPVHAICAGRTGSTQVLKADLGTYRTQSGAQTVAATNDIAYIGYAGSPIVGTIYEVWAGPVTPSDAMFTEIEQAVKTRLSITAW